MKDMKYLGVALGIVILSIVAIVAIASVYGGSTKKKTTTTTSKSIKLLDYENKDASVSVTIKGHLTGEEKHRSIRMTITPEDRGIELLEGYENTVVRSQHYPNTQAAYAEFLHALNYTGFVSKRPSTITDERGFCASGNVFYYDLYDERSQQVSHLWGASCAATFGTFAGVGPSVRQLFQGQITDYDKFNAGVQL